MAAMAQNGRALVHASVELKADRGLIRVAVLHQALHSKRAAIDMIQDPRSNNFCEWLPSASLRQAWRQGSLQSEGWWQALRTEAARVQAGGKLVAPLQRLAFVACFKPHLTLRTVHDAAATSAHELFGDSLRLMPSEVLFDFDAIIHAQHGKPLLDAASARGSALFEMPAVELVARACAQGWQWRDGQEEAAADAELEPEAEGGGCALIRTASAAQRAAAAGALEAVARHETQLAKCDAELRGVRQAVTAEVLRQAAGSYS